MDCEKNIGTVAPQPNSQSFFFVAMITLTSSVKNRNKGYDKKRREYGRFEPLVIPIYYKRGGAEN